MTDLYAKIKKANAECTTVSLKGKDYVPVSERVKAFRKVFPAGRIDTEIRLEEKTCLTTATVYLPAFYIIPEAPEPLTMVPIATGHAEEREGSSNVNRTSHVENCETSAIGRALGVFGIGTDTSIASADEVENATLNDISKTKISPEALTALLKKCREADVDVSKLCGLYKLKKLEDCNWSQYSYIVNHWDMIALH